MKRSYYILTSLLLIGLLCIHVWGAQLGRLSLFIEHVCPGLISTDSWVRALDDSSTDRNSAYNVLQQRQTDKAIELALRHIRDDDAYLWLNAASYLGSRSRPEATPYLIKSIRHTAWRSVEDRVDDLKRITGEDFGLDFMKWKYWYLSTNPEVVPDWNFALGHNPKKEDG